MRLDLLADVAALSDAELAVLTHAELVQVAALLEQGALRRDRRKLATYFPDRGPLRRTLYRKHMEFFRAGAVHSERLLIAANRTGKTEAGGGYETAVHTTGRYPWWWEGKRFGDAIDAWGAGKTNETTRDIIQAKLFGETAHPDGVKRVTGTGLIPFEDIGEIVWKRGSNLIDYVKIAHHRESDGAFDGWSRLGLKSYEQGPGSFEGTEKHWIWLDEEPPVDVYAECLTRTMTTDGSIVLTFTPLQGLSDTVKLYMPEGIIPDTQAPLYRDDEPTPANAVTSEAA